MSRFAGRFASLGDERGSSLVEFMLGASLLFMVVFGIIVLSIALYSYNVVSESAREATRFASVRGSACTSFATACPATAADIQSFVQGLTFPVINSANMSASTTWSAYPAGGTCYPLTSCNNPENQVQIRVTYQFPVNIPFLPRRILNMSSTAAMVISQ